ncbi:hypothetical protein BDD12DRAFT_829667, partial [Trichophaea hybrida]
MYSKQTHTRKYRAINCIVEGHYKTQRAMLYLLVVAHTTSASGSNQVCDCGSIGSVESGGSSFVILNILGNCKVSVGRAGLDRRNIVNRGDCRSDDHNSGGGGIVSNCGSTMCLLRCNGKSTRLRLLVRDSDGHRPSTSASGLVKSRNNWNEGWGDDLVDSSRLLLRSAQGWENLVHSSRLLLRNECWSVVSLVGSRFVFDSFRNCLGDDTTITQSIGNSDILGRFGHKGGRLDSIVRNTSVSSSSSGHGNGTIVSISTVGTLVDHAAVHVMVFIRGRG